MGLLHRCHLCGGRITRDRAGARYRRRGTAADTPTVRLVHHACASPRTWVPLTAADLLSRVAAEGEDVPGAEDLHEDVRPIEFDA